MCNFLTKHSNIFLKHSSGQIKHIVYGRWARGLQVTNSVFVWGTSRLIVWPRQADEACGAQVNFTFSVLLLVSTFTERFGEGSD